MSDDIVIIKGRVIGISAGSVYNTPRFEYDFNQVSSTVDANFGKMPKGVTILMNPDGTIASVTVPGMLEFGSEYEFIMRPVKKEAPKAEQPTGPRKFKDEEE